MSDVARNRFAAGLLAATLAAAGPVWAAPAPARTGLLVFISGRTETVLPITVSQLRIVVTRAGETALQRLGHDVAPTSAVVALARQERIRSSMLLTPAFLAAARDSVGVADLVVAHVIVEAQRVVALVRGVETSSGRVNQVWLAEQPVAERLTGEDPAGETAALLAAVQGVMAQLTSPVSPATSAASVLVMPTIGVGCDADMALTATFCVLGAALASHDARPIDPALVLSDLLAAGFDPQRLQHAAYQQLQDHFGVSALVRPELVAFDDLRGSGVRSAMFDDAAPSVHATGVRDFAFTLRTIDLPDGLLAASATRYRDRSDDVRWFGSTDTTPLMRILQRSADRLWQDLRSVRKES